MSIGSNGREAIQREVEKLLRSLDERREELWAGSPPSDPLDLIDPRIIATKILGVRYSEPMEIPSPAGHGRIAGWMDRTKGEISVAQSLSPEVQRFTAAHEIGHWVLHPGAEYFRDAPTDGGDRDKKRPIEEREADSFAAALLMPEDLVRKHFRRHFGVDTLADSQVDEDLAALLSFGTGKEKEVKPSTFKTTRDVSKWAARCFSLRTQSSISLASLFKVSIGAMAIRLEELKLIPKVSDPDGVVSSESSKTIAPRVQRRKAAARVAGIKLNYDVFISYSKKDKKFVQKVVSRLREHGLKPWFDEFLVPGVRWIQGIEGAMKKSRTAAVLLGPQGFKRYQEFEVEMLVNEFFIELERPIIPVFIPGWSEKMPLLLKGFHCVDLRQDDPEAWTRLIDGIVNGVSKAKLSS